MTEQADSILIQRCKVRDKDAYRLLVERYKKQAYGFAFSYLKNVDDAYTISQESFIRAWNAIGKFEDGRNFRSWLLSIVKHLSLNLILKKKRLREISLENAMEESGFDIADNSNDPLETLEKNEQRREVWTAVMKLKEEFREIIILKHFNDLSYREISETLDIPEGTVMSRLYHARLVLKENLVQVMKRG
ncbi:RNA polymerase sigma factor [Candidatus Latescibacterota bacterium]